MTIKRIIAGTVHEFELTASELYAAHVEQEHIYDTDNVKSQLMICYPNSEYTDDEIDAIAWEVRRQINKYDLDFDYAVDEALVELQLLRE